MHRVSVLARVKWAFVAWLLLLPSVPVAGASDLVVQHIGELSGTIAEAVAEDAVDAGVTILPFSPRRDARATPIILAPDKAFLARNGKRVLGLRPAERRAIRQAYDAGQVILLLDASTHDIEELHVLVGDGVALASTTDPVVLAYALRQDNEIATVRVITHPVEDDFDGEDFDETELEFLSQALEIVIEELTLPPADLAIEATASSMDWGSSPVQRSIITSTDRGTYNTPVEFYALHSCLENKDYYLVSTGGTWTPTQARFQSASNSAGELSRNGDALVVRWEDNRRHCFAGLDVSDEPFGGRDRRICRYMDYPLAYQVDMVPQFGPRVVQFDAAPAGDQGRSASYTSGLSFSISGGVDVSGDGPSGGLQASVTWDRSVTTEVPPLVVEAGNQNVQGTFTRYRYCTTGDSVANCSSAIQMTGQVALCQNLFVGDPQNGQTPNGRLSGVGQMVVWQVDPETYTGDTFDITITFEAQLATTTSKLWFGSIFFPVGPRGNCNNFGCSCGIDTTDSSNPVKVSQTFKVPRPSTKCSP